VLNGNNDQTYSNQLQALFTDVRCWQQLIDFIENNYCPKEPYFATAIYQCNFMQDELDKKHVGLYAPGQMMIVPLYDPISYNSSLSYPFQLKLGHNVNVFVVEMKTATVKDIVEHGMRLAKEFPTSHVKVSYACC
jgi:hypothetical protein